MGDCIPVDAANNFAAKDVNRIIGKIAEVLALKSPFLDILKGGTLPNVSDTVRSVVQERAVPNASLAQPVFTNDINLCNVIPDRDQVGSTEYSYQLQSLRGRGPLVCVKQARTAFMGSYLQAQLSLEKVILQIMNADIRNTLYSRSGVKFVCRDDQPFTTLLTGDQQQIDTEFFPQVPNAPLNFKTLRKLGAFLKEEMLADPFESEQGTMFKFIGSDDQIERLRNDLDVKADLLALVTGKYAIGERSINGYSFQGPYRNFAFGIDQQPLRATGLNGDGSPILVEPEISVPTSNGVAARRNPVWVSAPYEIGFLIAADSFERLVPEKYTGEGTFKFNPQLSAGELLWRYIIDNDCNLFGDYGQHIYQISRAYRPVRPQNVIPILYQRCPFESGLTNCSSSINGL